MESRRRSGLLAIAALVAVGIYSLSCKPAWSPDSGKVAYIAVSKVGEGVNPIEAFAEMTRGSSGDKKSDDAEKKESPRHSVAVYDVKSKKCREVLGEALGEDGLHMVPIEVFWPKGGDTLVIVSVPSDDSTVKDRLLVCSHDLRSKTTRVLQDLPMSEVSGMSSLAPMILHKERWLWLCADEGEKGACYRVDLKKGRVRKLSQPEFFIGGGERVFYAKEGPDNAIVFGRVKTFWGLKEKTLFTVPGQGEDDFGPVLTMPSRCERFACVRKRGDTSTLEVFDGHGQRINTIALPGSVEFDGMPTGVEWTPDGAVLWMAVAGEDADGASYAGLAEIAVDDGSTRIIKLNPDGLPDGFTPLQLSLSPDGSYLAVTMMGDECVRLCLVDLRDEGRPVTLAPEPTAPQSAGAG
jgi:hypothetical protein